MADPSSMVLHQTTEEIHIDLRFILQPDMAKHLLSGRVIISWIAVLGACIINPMLTTRLPHNITLILGSIMACSHIQSIGLAEWHHPLWRRGRGRRRML